MTAHSTGNPFAMVEEVGRIGADTPTALVGLRPEPASSLGHPATIDLREDEALLIVQDALDSICAAGGFTYAHVARHTLPDSERVFYAASGHRGPITFSGDGRTLGDAVAAVLVAEPFDTSKMEQDA